MSPDAPQTARTGRPLGAGIVGCGVVSTVYATTLHRSPGIRLVGCTDAHTDAARALADRFRITPFPATTALLEDPAVEIVLVLTPPSSHAALAAAALAAGKHVYTEKPLALTVADGSELLASASASSRRLAAAPDTILGDAWCEARRLLQAGTIGVPVSASASFLCPGHEAWHPNPSFYYEAGGGPLFDMGPYYLTALVHLLGPIRSVVAASQTTFAERQPTHGPNAGRTIPVDVPTHVSAVLSFELDVTATLTMSFDVWARTSSQLTIHGTEGSLVLPDPNGFLGALVIDRPDGSRERIRPERSRSPQRRGLGVIDLAASVRAQTPHRASAETALHVLEAMESIQKAAAKGRRQQLTISPAAADALRSSL